MKLKNYPIIRITTKKREDAKLKAIYDEGVVRGIAIGTSSKVNAKNPESIPSDDLKGLIKYLKEKDLELMFDPEVGIMLNKIKP